MQQQTQTLDQEKSWTVYLQKSHQVIYTKCAGEKRSRHPRAGKGNNNPLQSHTRECSLQSHTPLDTLVITNIHTSELQWKTGRDTSREIYAQKENEVTNQENISGTRLAWESRATLTRIMQRSSDEKHRPAILNSRQRAKVVSSRSLLHTLVRSSTDYVARQAWRHLGRWWWSKGTSKGDNPVAK